MTTTRAAAKKAAILQSRHPQHAGAFREGLGSVLRQWTALELAVHHQVRLFWQKIMYFCTLNLVGWSI